MSDNLLTYFKNQQDDIVSLLISLIEHESFTPEKAHVDKLGDFIIKQLQSTNPSSVKKFPQEAVGDPILVKWNEDAPQKPIMVLMHMDTVWPIGTLAERPVQIADDGRLYGPGSLDMKGGIAVSISAIKALIERSELPNHPIWFMFTSDEERGSANSEDLIREYAAQCGQILVMEFPTPNGSLKTARKGVAVYRINVTGRASHSGNHPEEGINAIHEMAQQIVSISKLQDLRNGISIAVNTIAGGRTANVIAPDATATVDVRTFTQFDMDRIHDELMNLYPKIPGAKVEVLLRNMRPPMENNELMAKTFAQAEAIGRSIGLSITQDTVGGGSDGNITASIGVPTLDGLGPLGAGAHADHEHIIIRSLPERAAHMAAMLRDWQFE